MVNFGLSAQTGPEPLRQVEHGDKHTADGGVQAYSSGDPRADGRGGEWSSCGCSRRCRRTGTYRRGYRGQDWIESQTDAAGNVPIGAGFITWRLQMSPELLDVALARRPSAICLSFGDPQPFAKKVHAANVPLICQVQSLLHARRAAEVGATIVVAQGAEAGGHGGSRSVSTLVPEIADFLTKSFPDTLLCAAGGMADGRGLAAALILGADGVLVGSRLWASEEANVNPNFHAAALLANGDATIRKGSRTLSETMTGLPITQRVS